MENACFPAEARKNAAEMRYLFLGRNLLCRRYGDRTEIDMTENQRHQRSDLLFGEGATLLLRGARVAVFGLGGVGSYATEALARMGIGTLALFDGDVYTESNLNRQLYALPATLGTPKVEAARAHIEALDPSITVKTHAVFVTPETLKTLDLSAFDYLVDAVDTLSTKVALAVLAEKSGVPLISAMGAANKTDPSAFRVADIYATKTCPLARIVRTELRKQGVKALKVVYSEEPPTLSQNRPSGKEGLGSCSFVPSAMGLIMAGEVIKDLLRQRAETAANES